MKTCTSCLISKPESDFAVNRNRCKNCRKIQKSISNKAWRIDNKEHLKSYREDYWAQMPPGHRRKGVVKSVQRSPEAWMLYQMQEIRKRCRYRAKLRGATPAMLAVEIDAAYLLELWNSTDGRCGLTGVQMVHEILRMDSCSVDRIDANKGYIKGNVQLVCAGINLMKNNWTQAETIEFILKLRDVCSVFSPGC